MMMQLEFVVFGVSKFFTFSVLASMAKCTPTPCVFILRFLAILQREHHCKFGVAPPKTPAVFADGASNKIPVLHLHCNVI